MRGVPATSTYRRRSAREAQRTLTAGQASGLAGRVSGAGSRSNSARHGWSFWPSVNFPERRGPRIPEGPLSVRTLSVAGDDAVDAEPSRADVDEVELRLPHLTPGHRVAGVTPRAVAHVRKEVS